MAFDPAPSSLFSSWSEDGTDITVPIASITGLTANEADGTTGDWRSILGRILDHSYNYREGLASADKPTKLTISRTLFEANGSVVYRYIVEWSNDLIETSTTAE